jgi:hypothetical protein
LACLALAAPASATFHEMKIREVYPGSDSLPNVEYVELEMWRSGQNFVENHSIKLYNATGTMTGFHSFSADADNGQNQRRILIGTDSVATTFGKALDQSYSDVNEINRAGGAACWESIDCVTWGNFTPPLVGFPDPQTNNAPAITDAMALRRTISPDCPTLLESGDDTDDSSIDFTEVTPDPFNNADPPGGTACPAPPAPPSTVITKSPKNRSRDRTPTWRFSSSPGGASFECRLDAKPFAPCTSPFTKRVKRGKHTFKVRARNGNGADATPAIDKFRVLRRRHG